MSGKLIDITGKRFGHLTVIGIATKNPTYPTRRNWKLLCDCGNYTFAPTKILTVGEKLTCGSCKYHSEALNTRGTHNQSKTKLYRVWYGILERCNNKNIPQFKNYGARGIAVCEEWITSYQAFYLWSKESGYKEGLTIDRIDNNGNYTPENCRWATRKEQSLNKRTNVFLTYLGDSKTISQWKTKLGFKRGVISGRLKRGWTVERALSTAVTNMKGGMNH